MPTELHWPRRATFIEHPSDGVDDEEHRYVGPGTFEVPTEMVDAYLDRGWERPDSDTADAAESPAAASQPDAEAAAEAIADVEAEPEDEAEGFDAQEFIDRSWQATVAAIEDGEADGNLDQVRAAENNRDGDPRNSVIDALDQRAG